jgi:hypothetical protein
VEHGGLNLAARLHEPPGCLPRAATVVAYGLFFSMQRAKLTCLAQALAGEPKVLMVLPGADHRAFRAPRTS